MINDLADPDLLRAAADSHRAWFAVNARAAGRDVVQVDGTTLALDHEAMTFPEPGEDVDVEAVIAAAGDAGCVGIGWWSLAADPVLGARLVARGFGWGWRPHWMAIDLHRMPAGPPASRYAIVPAEPPYARTLPYAPSGPEPAGTVRLGVRLREKLIGQVVVHPVGEVAGIFSMAVVPRVRRRGIGAALTRAACELARERGCRHAVLNATEMGIELYTHVGFRSLGWGQTWWWSPGPAPTARQTALAEAIGLGDVGTVESLAPSVAELRAPLAGGELPLLLAVLVDQAAVVEWMLTRHPELAGERFEPHAATLLHVAVEYDRPAVVEAALAHGVDPALRDATFGGTALGWAEHFGREDLARRLAAG